MTMTIKSEWENNGSRVKIKGTKAKEKKQRLRGEMKGAESAKGENKMHDGENEM